AHAGRNGRSAEILILGPAAVDAYGLAQALRFLREHREVQQTLDLLFYAVRELAARAIEEFDAIVLVRVVRGADDHAEAASQPLSHVRDARCRQRSDQHDID